MLVIMAGAVLALATVARADSGERVSSEELIEDSDYYDRRTVVYTGEVVGDVLERGEYCWITVNDDHYGHKPVREYQELKGGNTGMGVYCRSDMLEDVTFLGSYRTAGDLIKVTGVFYKASPRHGGDTMIEAEEISVIRKGWRVKARRGFAGEVVALILLVVAALAMGAVWLRKSRKTTTARSG
jgi:hypothetical protein